VGFVNEAFVLGHHLRDGASFPQPNRQVRTPVVIVGGGIGGLSAAWWLERNGFRDFVLLEMERQAGGNARWGENDITAYPWAAHYVPVPDAGVELVRELFRELGVLDETAGGTSAISVSSRRSGCFCMADGRKRSNRTSG
jgi:glycine/D-amino acid oxidase-like deaminating enzyme